PGAGARAGAVGRPRRGALAGRPAGPRGGLVVVLALVVLVLVGGRDPAATTARRRRDDLVLVVLGLGGDLGLGGLELGGVVDARGLRVELFVGQHGVGDVVAFPLLVAHCASLASWWWPLRRRDRLLVCRAGRGDRT